MGALGASQGPMEGPCGAGVQGPRGSSACGSIFFFRYPDTVENPTMDAIFDAAAATGHVAALVIGIGARSSSPSPPSTIRAPASTDVSYTAGATYEDARVRQGRHARRSACPAPPRGSSSAALAWVQLVVAERPTA